jgi:hypothetical protein
MARRSKKLNPAEKQRRQAKRQELDRLESITGMTERLTCLDSLACQAVNDCELQVENLEFDLAASRLAVEFWVDHPAAQHVVAMFADLEVEHRRHCEALTALGARFDAFLHSQANLPHVHLRPSDPYRQRVEDRLYPPAAPVG